MIILAGALIGLGIYLGLKYFADTQKLFHVKPRSALAQVTVAGSTEESEQMHSVITLFTDETKEQWQEKLNFAFSAREDRLKFQNDRMIKLREESIKLAEEAQKEAKRLGIPTKVTPINQSK